MRLGLGEGAFGLEVPPDQSSHRFHMLAGKRGIEEISAIIIPAIWAVAIGAGCRAWQSQCAELVDRFSVQTVVAKAPICYALWRSCDLV